LKRVPETIFKKIVKKIDILGEIDKLGLKGFKSGVSYMICCPFHGEKSPSFGICISGENKGTCNCLSANCGVKTTIFHLIAKIEGIDLKKVVKRFDSGREKQLLKELQQQFYKNITKSNKDFKLKKINKNILKKFRKPDGRFLEYLKKERKLNDKIIEKFELLKCEGLGKKKTWKNRIIIPAYDTKKNLISLTARSIIKDIDKRNKVRKLKDTDIKNILFGLNNIKNKKKLVLVEGEFDAIYFQMFKIPAVAIGNTDLTDEQIKILIKHCEKIYLCLDGDVLKYILKKKKRELSKHMQVLMIKLPKDKDPNNLNKKEILKIKERIK
jgi:DNA primase